MIRIPKSIDNLEPTEDDNPREKRKYKKRVEEIPKDRLTKKELYVARESLHKQLKDNEEDIFYSVYVRIGEILDYLEDLE